jgi:Lsr2
MLPDTARYSTRSGSRGFRRYAKGTISRTYQVFLDSSIVLAACTLYFRATKKTTKSLDRYNVATQIQTLLIDDLTGGRADETVPFALDGTAFEIDLSTKNAKQLRKAFAPFVANARRAAAMPARGRRRASGKRKAPEKSSEIRAWAKAHGIPVSERGRIASSVIERYESTR